MSKTIEEIKNEWAQKLNNGHGNCCKNWKEYVSNNDIDEEDITEIAERYAQSQTQELQERNAELVRMLEDVKGYLGSDKRNEVDTLLTKYNHLKSNTNEKIDL